MEEKIISNQIINVIVTVVEIDGKRVVRYYNANGGLFAETPLEQQPQQKETKDATSPQKKASG